MIKLIVMDLDGTLLNSKKEVLPSSIEALNYARKKGAIICIASGRPPKKVLEYYDKIKSLDVENHDVLLCFNGSYIMEAKSSQPFYHIGINSKIYKELRNEARKHNVNTYALGDEMVYYEKMDQYVMIEANLNEIPAIAFNEESLQDDFFLNKAMLSSTKEELDKMEQIMPNLFPNLHFVRSESYFYEALNQDVDKWNGILKICSHYGIDPSEVMTFGDAGNDYDMIHNAGYGIAMGNAMEFVKKASFYVTDTCDSDGISKAIYHFIK